jgi:molecular chaperone GrpE
MSNNKEEAKDIKSTKQKNTSSNRKPKKEDEALKRKDETLEKEKHKEESKKETGRRDEDGEKKQETITEEATLEDTLEEKEESQQEEMKTQYLRLAADFANYKKRSEKERTDIRAFANEKLVANLLEVLDNFDRALVREGQEKDPVLEGMMLIHKQLLGILENAGLEEIEALGSPFNPEFHEALMMDSSTEQESGIVTEVFQKGYMLHKKVIRPTRVKVAQ